MGFLTLRSSSMKPLSRILFKPFVLYLGHNYELETKELEAKVEMTVEMKTE
jgi:hypothetical protein